MKKILLSAMAITLLGTSTTMAQKGFSMSVKGTPAFTFLQNSDDADNSLIEKKATIKANFGIGVDYHFTDNAGVGLDVLYSFQGQDYEIAGKEINQKLEYVKIPVFFTYNTDASRTTSFYGKVGPQVNLLTKAEITGETGDIAIENKDKYEKATIGGMANAGVQFRLNQNLFLQTGFTFDYDFSNAENKDYSGFLPGRANTQNMTTGIQVGLKYQF